MTKAISTVGLREKPTQQQQDRAAAVDSEGPSKLQAAFQASLSRRGFVGLVLVLTAIFQRLRWKYQERAYRYALLEAGHLGQNAYLAATSMGMGACAVGAFLDDDLNDLLGVDGQDEAAIYMLAVGKV